MAPWITVVAPTSYLQHILTPEVSSSFLVHTNCPRQSIFFFYVIITGTFAKEDSNWEMKKLGLCPAPLFFLCGPDRRIYPTSARTVPQATSSSKRGITRNCQHCLSLSHLNMVYHVITPHTHPEKGISGSPPTPALNPATSFNWLAIERHILRCTRKGRHNYRN